jgi:hypothetical protein
MFRNAPIFVVLSRLYCVNAVSSVRNEIVEVGLRPSGSKSRHLDLAPCDSVSSNWAVEAFEDNFSNVLE